MAHPPHQHSTPALEQLDRVRRICLSLPEATEKIAWGAPTFRAKGKMFAMFMNNHHGSERIELWLHAPPGAQGMLVESDPERYFVPPYQGPSGWIGLYVDLFDDAEIEQHAIEAFCVVAPKKLQALVSGGGE